MGWGPTPDGLKTVFSESQPRHSLRFQRLAASSSGIARRSRTTGGVPLDIHCSTPCGVIVGFGGGMSSRYFPFSEMLLNALRRHRRVRHPLGVLGRPRGRWLLNALRRHRRVRTRLCRAWPVDRGLLYALRRHRRVRAGAILPGQSRCQSCSTPCGVIVGSPRFLERRCSAGRFLLAQRLAASSSGSHQRSRFRIRRNTTCSTPCGVIVGFAFSFKATITGLDLLLNALRRHRRACGREPS